MKKTILAVLMAVMIATPCLAQEVEPEGMFSIEGTLWETLPIGLQILPFPFIWPMNDLQIGFYGGEVYLDGSKRFVENSFYADMLVCSVFSGSYKNTSIGYVGSSVWYSGILQPVGIGMVFGITFGGGAITVPMIHVALLIKTDNNWTPPAIE